MHDLRRSRPFKDAKTPDMLALCERELLHPQDPALGPRLELATLVWHEIRTRDRSTAKLEKLFAKAGAAPIPWLIEARSRLRAVKRNKKGRHHIYAVRLDFDGQQGVYIGETYRTIENRFRIHRSNAKQGSGVVRRRGREVLQSLTAHLNPLSKAEAKQLEPILFEMLKGSEGLKDSHRKGGH